MENIFNIGDRVIVKERTYPSNHYPLNFVDGMLEYVGNTYIIDNVIIHYYRNIFTDLPGDEACYTLSTLDGKPLHQYKWSSPMLKIANISILEL